MGELLEICRALHTAARTSGMVIATIAAGKANAAISTTPDMLRNHQAHTPTAIGRATIPPAATAAPKGAMIRIAKLAQRSP